MNEGPVNLEDRRNQGPKSKAQRQAESDRRIQEREARKITDGKSPDNKDTSSSPSADNKPNKSSKEKRPDSDSVRAWKELKLKIGKYPADATIHILKPHTASGPKRDGTRSKANTRYAIYKEGMTVAKYLEKCKESAGLSSVSQGNADLLWDAAIHLIEVRGGTYTKK
jgi:hypothetical protein